MTTLTEEQYQTLIKRLAETLTDNADLNSLMDFFYQAQVDFLNTCQPNFLIEYAKEMLGEDFLDAEEIQKIKDEKNGVYPDKWDDAN